MCKSRAVRLGFALTLAAVLSATSVNGQTDRSASEAARLVTYKTPSGETFFALSLQTKRTAPVQPTDVVVLFDTSASQTGRFRSSALETLEQLLVELSPQDRIRLMAIDIDAVALTDGFASRDSREINRALSKLRRRAPLGSTDMGVAMDAIVASFKQQAGRRRAAIYIGDGQSKSNVLDQHELSEHIRQLVESRIPFTGCAIGVQRNFHMLAALANQTGGTVLANDDISGQEMGAALAAATRETVFWPVDSKFSDSVEQFFPRTVPPLRSDRDTVLIGTLKSQGPHEIQLSVEMDHQHKRLSWQVDDEPSSTEHSFLPQLVEAARQDGGLTLPILGSTGLREAQRILMSNAHRLAKIGEQAMAGGDHQGAQRLADAAAKVDPEHPVAKVIQQAIHRRKTGNKTQATEGQLQTARGEAPLRLVAQPAETSGSLLNEVPAEYDEGFTADGGQLLSSVERDQQVRIGRVLAQVEAGLKDARDTIGSDPTIAERDLKLLLDIVDRTVDLDPKVAQEQRHKIQTLLRQARRQRVSFEEKRQLNLERLAIVEGQQRLLRDLERRELKIQALMEQFHALMDEGRYKLATDVPAAEARELAPELATPVLAGEFAGFKGNLIDNLVLREVRQKAVIDTLYQVEKSFVPFPDEPPVVYPDPEVWRALTERRKKYKTIDLAKPGSNEERILRELNQPTTFEFLDSTLQEVADYVEDIHGIEVELDDRALEELGIATDTPVTRNLTDISLRSALRLTLGSLDLTYTVRDEVLLITTTDKVNEHLVTKVYPVADLVLPIESQSVNPFMMGGGMGRMGGGMGGGMGGMGGMGGGMGGMGGGMGGMRGGMGGGFFSVPSEKRITPGGTSEFQAFAVAGDLKLVESPRNQPAINSKSNPTTPKKQTAAKAIQLAIVEGSSVSDAWNEFFQQLELDTETREHPANIYPSSADVRQTCRELMGTKQFDQVVAMLQAALTHGHAQPWMYEALALAMRASQAPPTEIERALMSAVDFADSVEDLLLVAVYFTRLGDPKSQDHFDRRALRIFREVSTQFPLRVEPYQLALATAERLDDREAIQWSVLGIRSQAWPANQRYIEDLARGAALKLAKSLESEGKTDELSAFQQALTIAEARDCKIVITWTGDADVDLMVEEPTGTVCSFRTPRTAGGGVMVGDSAARLGDQESTLGVCQETYVCAQAFAGQYRMLLRRVFGNVTAGKVNVQITMGSGTPREKHIRKIIPLSEKDAMITFSVPDGRRNEPLDEQLVASTARAHTAVNRAILAQQLSSTADSDAVLRLAAARQNNQVALNSLRRPAGFMPIITQLPEGANLQVSSAVVSADRRYVRITALPFFSQIGEVASFRIGGGGGGGEEGDDNDDEG